MKRFLEPIRNQILLLVYVALDTVAPIESPVRIINDLVDELDTSEIEKTYKLEVRGGRKPIHPKTMIKVCLLAMHNCRFSLRKMEEDTRTSLTYIWLTGGITIDHTTMCNFLNKYVDYVEEIFTQVVMVAKESDLIGFEILSIDSVKIRGNASYKQDRTLASIEKSEVRIKKRISELLDKVDQDAEESKELRILKKRKAKLEKAKGVLKERIETKKVGLSEKAQTELEAKEKINITDNDTHRMQQRNGEVNPSYSITTPTDAKADIIAHYQLNEENDDAKALSPSIQGSYDKTGEKHEIVVSDSGSNSFDNLEKLKASEQEALIPNKRYEVEKSGNLKRGEYDRSKFQYDKEKDVYTCPSGMELEKTCKYMDSGREKHRYENKEACTKCPNLNECSKGNHRTITRDSKEALKEEMSNKLNQEENQTIYKKRAHASETIYGQFKHNLKYRIFMRRGYKKVSMEMGLLCMLHNILKIGKSRLGKVVTVG